MFKGLKSKIAEETKKLQTAVVTQMSESLASGGSASSDRVRQAEADDFVPPMSGPASRTLTKPKTDNLVDVSLSPQQTSAFMEGSEEIGFGADLQRSDSFNSINSIGSGVNFFPQVPQLNQTRLMTIHDTDTESIADSTVGSSVLNSASKEQISSVLHKLQGRAANYKDKYRQLAGSYKELLRDNDKCRSVLTTTQDKALRRIDQLREEKELLRKELQGRESTISEKLDTQDRYIVMLRKQVELAKEGQEIDSSVLEIAKPVAATSAKELVCEREKVRKLEELLTRCKDSIRNNKEKMNHMSVENQQLKITIANLQKDVGNASMGEFAGERVANEWRGRLEKAERDWAKKLADADERGCVAVAEAKKGMHEELEAKEGHLQQVRTRLKAIQSAASEESNELQNCLAEARQTIEALELEKKDLMDKMSKNKLDVVKLVKEEEEQKREQLLSECQTKAKSEIIEWEKKVQEIHEMYKNKIQEKLMWSKKSLDLEEQMQLALEEREMQKNAALMHQDTKQDHLQCQLEQLTTEKLEMQSNLNKLTNEMEQMKSKMGEMIQQQRETLDLKDKEIEKLVENVANGEVAYAETVKDLDKKLEHEKSANNELRHLELANQDKFKSEVTALEVKLSALESELEERGARLESLEVERATLLKNAENSQKTEIDLKKSVDDFEAQLSDLNKKYEATVTSFDLVKSELEEKSSTVSSLKDELSRKDSEFADKLRELANDKQSESIIEEIKMEFERKEVEFKENLKIKNEEMQRLQELLDAKNIQLNETISSKTETETCLQQKQADLENLEAIKNEAQDELKSVKNCLGQSLHAFVHSLKAETAATSKELVDSLEAGIGGIEDSTTPHVVSETISSILEFMSKEMTSLVSKSVQNDLNISNLKSEVETVSRNHQFAVKERDIQIEELKDLMSGLEEAVGVYRKEWGSGKQRERDMQDQIKDEKRSAFYKLTESEQRMDEVSNRVGELEDAIEVYKRQFSDRQNQVNILTQEKEGSGVELSNVRKHMENVMRDSFFALKEREADLQRTQERLNELEEAVDAYQKQSANVKKNRAEQNCQLESLKTQLVQSQQQLQLVIDQKVQLEHKPDHSRPIASKLLDLLSNMVKIYGSQIEAAKHNAINCESFEPILLSVSNQISKIQNIFNENNTDIDIEEIDKDVEKLVCLCFSSLTSLAAQLQQNNEALKESEKDKLNLKNELDAMTESLTQLQSSVQELEIEKNKFIAQIQEKQVQIENLAQAQQVATNDNDNKQQALQQNESQVEELTEQLRTQKSEFEVLQLELETTKTDVETLKNELNCKTESLNQTTNSMQEMENEKLKLIAQIKENQIETEKLVLAQKEIEAEKIVLVQSQALTSSDKENEKQQMQQILQQKQSNIEELATQLDAQKSDYKCLKLELESLKTGMAEQRSEFNAQLLHMEGLETEKQSLLLSLKEGEERLKSEVQRVTNEGEERISENRKKLQGKMNQIKKQLQEEHAKNESSWKAQLSELKSKLDNKQREIEKLNALNEAFEEERNNYKLESAERKVEEMDENNKKMQGIIEDLKNQVQGASEEIERLKLLHDEEIKRVMEDTKNKNESENGEQNAKQEKLISKLERQIQEYKKEMKQLYSDLNEQALKQEEIRRFYEEQLKAKDDELSDAHKERVSALELKESQIKETLDEQQKSDDKTSESVSTLQEKVKDLENELKKVNETHFNEMSLLARGSIESVNMNSNNSTAAPYGSSFHSQIDNDKSSLLHPISLGSFPSSPLFTEPTEAEYLRNVLFRYMVERESLGKESVTLAKVIATVLKFSADQTQTVVVKEESRLPNWLRRPLPSAHAQKVKKTKPEMEMGDTNQ